MTMKRLIAVASALALSVGLIGCSTVQPWQKGNLAKPEMAFDSDPLEARFVPAVYAAKEAATGSTSVGGGGCGCN
jgi:hypothetical protein